VTRVAAILKAALEKRLVKTVLDDEPAKEKAEAP
jgi:hypothetical protein